MAQRLDHEHPCLREELDDLPGVAALRAPVGQGSDISDELDEAGRADSVLADRARRRVVRRAREDEVQAAARSLSRTTQIVS